MSENVKGKILFTEQEILNRARELGAQITNDFAGEELIVIGTLKGAIVWMADLLKCIDLDTKIDFITASSYGGETKSSGIVKILKDVELDLTDANVLIVEDIVDSGNTLSKVKAYFMDRQAKNVKVCTLLDKPSRRTVDITPDYIGFEVDDLFIIGYGLDFDQKYRNLPYISYLEE